MRSAARGLVGLLVLALVTAACSGDISGDGDGESSDPSTSTNADDNGDGSSAPEPAGDADDASSSSEAATGNFGFVADPDGELISFATLGGAVTGRSGVTTDPAATSGSGWIIAEAPGYATSYTTVAGVVSGANIVSTTLVPVGTTAFHPAGGEETVVTVGSVDAPTLELRFDPETFDEDALIEVTPLDLNLLDTIHAPMDTADELYVDHPFDIRARSPIDGSPLQPNPGQAVQLTLADGGSLGDPARLFLFDPDSGQWLEQADAACDRIDADHVGCQLSHFSHYSGGSATQPARPPARGTYNEASQTADVAYNKSLGEMGLMPNKPDEKVNCDPLTPDVVAALEREAQIAIAKSQAEPGEATKNLVLRTTTRMQLRGSPISCPDAYPGDSTPLADLDDATDAVIEAMAEALLPDPPCSDIDKVKKVVVEAQALGAIDGEFAGQLADEFVRLTTECNLFEGWIEYRILLPNTVEPVPEVKVPTRWSRGARTWTEDHEISILVWSPSIDNDHDSGDWDGTDHVETSFPEVVYRNDVEGTRCSFDVFDTTSLVGAPDEGMVDVLFSGNLFDGNPGIHWAPDEVSATNPISIETGHFRTGWAYDSGLACVKDEDFRVQLISPYAGQIAEKQFLDDTVDGQAFVGAFGAQLPSLWDILNQGPAGPRKSRPADGKGSFEQKFYDGYATLDEVVFPWGLFDMRVVMSWSITHTNYLAG